MTAETPHRPWMAARVLIPALGLGGAVLVLQRGPDVLAPAAACPGALEGVAIALARIAPSAPLGLWILRADRALAVAAVAALAILARRSCGAWPAAAAAALAFAAQPAFAPRLSVFGPASALMASVVFLVLLFREPAPGLGWRVWLAWLVAAAVAPGAALPLAVAAGWYVAVGPSHPPRWRTAAIGGTALAAGVLALEAAMPGRPPVFTFSPACLLPSWTGAYGADAAGELGAMLTSTGVFACSLAALGAFSRFGALRERSTWSAIAYAMAFTAAAWVGRDAARLLAPLMVAFWVLVAVGLAEAVRACGPGVGGRLAAGLLVVLLPLLQMSAGAAASRPSQEARPRGHERLTLQGVAQTLRMLPADSAIIVEDATVDLFLRALDGAWQRAGKTIRIVPRRAVNVAAATGHPGTRVFALPAAQAELWRIGFRLTDAPDWPGAVEVHAGGACTIVGLEWRELPDLLRSSTLALVAETDSEEGPITLYVSSDQQPAARAMEWPPLTTRGFHETSYGRSADADRIAASAREDGVPDGSPVLNAPFVTRLELWRTPGAPKALTVELGAMPTGAVARLRPDAAVPRLTVCPAFPFAPRSLASPE